MAINKNDLNKIKDLMQEVVAPINFRLDKIDNKLEINDQNWQKQIIFNEKMMDFKASQENFNATVDARLTRLEEKSSKGRNPRQKSPFTLKGIAGTLIANNVVSAQELLEGKDKYSEFSESDFIKLKLGN